MGRYIASINNTYVEYGDWEWDYVKQNKPKEYYDNAKISAEITIGDEKHQIEIPVEELADIKLVKIKYTWDWNKNKSLHRWLFNYIKNQGDEIVGIVYARLHTGGLEYEEPKVEGYYLQSDIGNENIVLSIEKKYHEIKKYEDFEWCRLRLLGVEYPQSKVGN